MLIADDQQLVRAGLRMILEAEDDLDIVAEAVDGQDALACCARHRPDVVLMDVRIPRLDGVAATRHLLAGTDERAPAVVVLTTYDVDEHVYDALRAGATGLLLKDAPPEQLVSAIRAAAAGDALLAPQVTRRLIERFARQAPAPSMRRALEMLSAREREVLALIGRGRSKRRDRRGALPRRGNGQDARLERVAQAGGPGSGASGGVAYEPGLMAPGDAAEPSH